MPRTSLDDALATPVAPAPDASFEALLAYLAEARGEHEQRLLDAGALLFRGWDVRSAEDLVRFVQAFTPGGRLFDYAGGASPRTSLGGGSYSSTEYPPHLQLALHNELSYSTLYPSRLFFLCVVEPEDGGETTIGDSRLILARMDAAVIEKLRTKDVRYTRNLSSSAGSGYSWQDAFETSDPAQAEAYCRRIGADFEWRGEGLMHVRQHGPATAVHSLTGEETWFNQADGFHPSALDAVSYAELLSLCGNEDRFRLNSAYGDGSPFEPATLAHIREAIRAETIPHRWRLCDILVLDNRLTAHGRMPFTGSRKIALAMT